MEGWRQMRGDRLAVSPVVATILLVAITVVLASVVYIMAGQLIQGSRTPTYVGMVLISTNGTASIVQVAGVSSSQLRWSGLTVVVIVNGTVDEASRLSPASAGTRGNITLEDSDGLVNDGDRFIVSIRSPRTYEIHIVEILTGAQVGQRVWST